MSWKNFLFENPDVKENAPDTTKNVKLETVTQKQDIT